MEIFTVDTMCNIWYTFLYQDLKQYSGFEQCLAKQHDSKKATPGLEWLEVKAHLDFS